MLWTHGVVELVRWRRERRAVASSAARLVEETEAYLASRPVPPGRPDPHPAEGPGRSKEPPQVS